MSDTDDRLQKVAELLIARGFAKNHILDDKRGRGSFEWTASGRSLHKHLLRLFDVPNVAPRDLNAMDIFVTISTILFTEPDK